jgi:N-acetylglutamate synthase-like GNAT family acetyltransferase
MAELLVRQAVPADIEQIAKLFVAEDLCKPEGLEAKVRRSLKCSSETCFVALENGVCIGAALSVFNGFHLFLSHVAVDSNHQRAGAGRMLLEMLVDRARQLGAAGIITDSRLTATGFFYNLGYRLPGAVFLIRSVQ